MDIQQFKPEYFENYALDGSTSSSYSDDKDIYPSSYLEYAKQDLSSGSNKRNYVNAVSNAKRAFHFQTDRLCTAYGWNQTHKNKNYGFPEKLEYLGQCGILSPNILRKLNTKRNEIEHDYYIPSKEEVEDYIDIVELFLMATKELLDSFPESVDYCLMKDDDYDISLELPDPITVDIKMSKGVIKLRHKEQVMKKTTADKDFYIWLSAIMRQHVL